jgi:hypothetical protein
MVSQMGFYPQREVILRCFHGHTYVCKGAVHFDSV